MNITQPAATLAASLGLAQAESAPTGAVAALPPALRKADARLQGQLDRANTTLSSLGRFKASLVDVQAAAKGLSGIGQQPGEASQQAARKALSAFATGFNAMVASGKALAAETGETGRISRALARAISSDLSRLDSVRQLGFSKAADGSLKLDAAKFDAAFKASPAAVASTASRLSQWVEQVVDKELASGSGVSDAMASLQSRSAALKLQQQALLKAAAAAPSGGAEGPPGVDRRNLRLEQALMAYQSGL